MTRRVAYVTGTRADYGLMRRTLAEIDGRQDLSLQIVVTGMHLMTDHGHTVDEIATDGFDIAALIPVALDGATGASMARAIGTMIIEMTVVFERDRPDIVVLLGDRGEMLAGALAALHLNIPIAHIHGGERSGTIDEPVRHAISKLSHYHLVATQAAGDRLTRMGEHSEMVHVVGAPGLDGLEADAIFSVHQCRTSFGLDPDAPIALLVFHPVVQEASEGGRYLRAILSVLREKAIQSVIVRPNADAGATDILAVLDEEGDSDDVQVITHMPRGEFVSWMRAADFMIGNSSAGIIEAASFGTPVINIGSRQNLRERNANVIDIAPEASAIADAVDRALDIGRFAPQNIYGDGQAAGRIADLLATLPVGSQILDKCCAY